MPEMYLSLFALIVLLGLRIQTKISTPITRRSFSQI